VKKLSALASIISHLLIPSILYAEHIPPTCSGDTALLSILDRPSVAFSACTVPSKAISIESGYSYQKATPSGYSHNVPQTELRIGLINNTEIDIFPPNYNETSNPFQAGFSSGSIGLKHVLFFDANQLASFQGLVTAPSSNPYFGSINTGFLINAIYSYSFNSGVSISPSVGFASVSSSSDFPTKNYYSINPILTMGWSLTDKINPYLEVYSQSKTAIDQSWGVSMDGGLIFLIAHNVSLDVSAGQRIAGFINSVDHYFGAGFSFALGL
jgi:hypothetical protein